MQRENLIFDKLGLIYDIRIPQQKEEFTLAKDDDLNDSELENQLDRAYQLITTAAEWYPIAMEHIARHSQDKSAYLTVCYLLEEDTFGLSFELDSEPEHGLGMKLNSSTFEIIEFGEAPVAFA